MTCFWTDLVGATQHCEDAPSLRFALSGYAATAPAASDVADMVDYFDANFDASSVLHRDVFGAADRNAIFDNVLGYWGGGDPSDIGFVGPPNPLFDEFYTSIGFAAADALWYESGNLVELVVSGALAVTEVAVIGDYACAANGLGLVIYPTTGYTATVTSPGVARLTGQPSELGTPISTPRPTNANVDGSYHGIGSLFLRVQGSVVGENGTTADVDVWMTVPYDGCF